MQCIYSCTHGRRFSTCIACTQLWPTLVIRNSYSSGKNSEWEHPSPEFASYHSHIPDLTLQTHNFVCLHACVYLFVCVYMIVCMLGYVGGGFSTTHIHEQGASCL
jgi:hypothetical protein